MDSISRCRRVDVRCSLQECALRPGGTESCGTVKHCIGPHTLGFTMSAPAARRTLTAPRLLPLTATATGVKPPCKHQHMRIRTEVAEKPYTRLSSDLGAADGRGRRARDSSLSAIDPRMHVGHAWLDT